MASIHNLQKCISPDSPNHTMSQIEFLLKTMKLENIFAMTSSIFSSRPSLMHFISVNFPKKSSFFEALGTNLATFLLCILTICSKQALILHFLKSCILFKSQKLGVFFFFLGEFFLLFQSYIFQWVHLELHQMLHVIVHPCISSKTRRR